MKADQAQCSRSFGFVAAFRKMKERQIVVPIQSEYATNRALFLKGGAALTKQKDRLRRVADAVKSYENGRKQIVFWAANDLMSEYLSEYPVSRAVSIIDSNPEKRGFLGEYLVLTPEQAREKICQADVIFLFTPFHAPAILHSLSESFGREFSAAHVHIVGSPEVHL